MIQNWQTECIQMYARNAISYSWEAERCDDKEVLSKIEALVNENGGDYNLFLRMMENYYDAQRCPAGDTGTGNPHRDMEAAAFEAAWRFFDSSCERFGLTPSEVRTAIYER